ncbi:hypothetical protein [Massilia antarctica]|uniref:hypothetical protein n=1 Tax=Massilia antarctica TaxID=2765360 RepID=UPI0011AF19C6|nr:hypothetical protein [Massilia sp. H27-R4]MCY0915812.1 hypothetical protein [Massilia sp. H27-R4]
MNLKNRVVGAFIALGVTGAGTIIFPFALVIFLRGHHWEIIYLYASIPYWGGVVLAVAACFGFLTGAGQVQYVLSQMFFYSENVNVALAIATWSALIVSGTFGYWLA